MGLNQNPVPSDVQIVHAPAHMPNVEEDLARRLLDVHRRACEIVIPSPRRFSTCGSVTAEDVNNLCDELRGLCDEAINVMQSLETECVRTDDDVFSALDGAGDQSSTRDPEAISVADMCFAGIFEVRGVIRSLEGNDDPEMRAIEADRARRKLRRSATAVLSSIARGMAKGGDSDARDGKEAARVRRRYTRLREALPAKPPSNEEELSQALRYVSVSLAVFFGRSEIEAVRIRDQLLLRDVHSRVVEWARSGCVSLEGKRIFEDIRTAFDLLREINRRQELIIHDRIMLESELRVLNDQPEAAEVLASLKRMKDLIGRDDEMDALMKQLDASGGLEYSMLIGAMERVLGTLESNSRAPTF